MTLPQGRVTESSLPKGHNRKTSKKLILTFAVLSALIFSAGAVASHFYKEATINSQRVGDVPESFLKAVDRGGDWKQYVTPESELSSSLLPPLKGDTETSELLNLKMKYTLGTPVYKLKCTKADMLSHDPEGCPQEASVPLTLEYEASPPVGASKKDMTFKVSGELQLTRPFYKSGKLTNPTRSADKIGPWTVTKVNISKVTYPTLDTTSCLPKIETFVNLSDTSRIQGRPYAPCTIADGNIITDKEVNFETIASDFPVMNEFHVDVMSATSPGIASINFDSGEFGYPYQQFIFPAKDSNYIFTFLLAKDGDSMKFVLAAVTVQHLEEVSGNEK